MKKWTIWALTTVIALSAVGCRVSADLPKEPTSSMSATTQTTADTARSTVSVTVPSSTATAAGDGEAGNTTTTAVTGTTTVTKDADGRTTVTKKETSATAKTEHREEDDAQLQKMQIDSLDKLNFYAVKKAIAQRYQTTDRAVGTPQASAMVSRTQQPSISPMGYTAEFLSPKDVFTITMYSYFTVSLDDPNGFLAHKLGGTGTVEVVITRNSFNNMITFKRGEQYYSCFQTAETDKAMTFSTRKYVKGFLLIENDDQENYEYTVYFDGDRVLGMHCGRLYSTVQYKYVADSIRLDGSFSFVIHKTEQFTAEQLEALFAFNDSDMPDGILLQDGSIVFGESPIYTVSMELKDSTGKIVANSPTVQKVYAMYHPTHRFCIRLLFNFPASTLNMVMPNSKVDLYVDGQRERTVTVQKDYNFVYLTGFESKSAVSDVFDKLTAQEEEERIGKIVDFQSFIIQMGKRLDLKRYDVVPIPTEADDPMGMEIYEFQLKDFQSLHHRESNYDVVIDGITLTLPMKVSKLFSLGFTLEWDGFDKSIGQGFVWFLSPQGNRIECYVKDVHGTANTFLDGYIAQLNVQCYEKKSVYQEGISPTRPNFVMLENIHKDSTLDDIIFYLDAPNHMILFTTENTRTGQKTAEIRLMYTMGTSSSANEGLVFNFSPIFNSDLPSNFLTYATITLM